MAGQILDVNSGKVLFAGSEVVPTSSHSSALGAYATWAAELGVSDTTSLAGLYVGDDGSGGGSLNFSPTLEGVSTRFTNSSEGGFGFWCDNTNVGGNASGNISATSPQIGISRYYALSTTGMPSVLIVPKAPSQDSRSVSAKWQQTDTEAIFYVHHSQYNTATEPIEMALRVKNGQINIVCSGTITDTCYLQVFTFNEISPTRSATTDHGGMIELVPNGQVVEIQLGAVGVGKVGQVSVNGFNQLDSKYTRGTIGQVTTSGTGYIERYISGFGSLKEIGFQSEPINEMSVTFDQLGNPIVIYTLIENGVSNVYLNWYDPTIPAYTTTFLGAGHSVHVGFDLQDDVSVSISDALVFYVRGSEIIMRVQRDRWATEYPEEILDGDGKPAEGLKITGLGMNTDRRYQVVYTFDLLPVKPKVLRSTLYSPIYAEDDTSSTTVSFDISKTVYTIHTFEVEDTTSTNAAIDVEKTVAASPEGFDESNTSAAISVTWAKKLAHTSDDESQAVGNISITKFNAVRGYNSDLSATTVTIGVTKI